MLFRCEFGYLVVKTDTDSVPIIFAAEPNVGFAKRLDSMDLKQLSELGGEVNVTVRLEDLRRWHEELTASAPPITSHQPNASELYTRKQTIALLGVDSSTLWRWAKSGYLVPVEYGGQRRYHANDVQRIFKGDR